MKKLGLALTLILASTPAFAEADYSDASQTINHDCNSDPQVDISGSSNQITLTGTCTEVEINGASNTVIIEASKKVSVTGANNEVTVTASDRISVTGANNNVVWKKGIKGKRPKISSTGIQNRIKQGK